MRILITGNMGYVGPVVAAHLRRTYPDAYLAGYDTGLFAAQKSSPGQYPEICLNSQIFGDIRDISDADVRGFDAVIHLAAISNDPMGNMFEEPTAAINFAASARLAEICARVGVAAFVFASSCSVYGAASDLPRKEEDELNPITAYARSKIDTERALAAIAAPDMRITCLRFATARGMSPRLRLDLVLNDFVACAVTAGEITILSDGTPWRPLIDVKDMARAIDWAIARSDGPRFLVVNAGADDQNFTIAELARAVADFLPGTTISTNDQAPPDKRSYRVDFGLFRKLAPNHQPVVTLRQSIGELVDGVRQWGGLTLQFRQSHAMRKFTLEQLIADGRLGRDIRWTTERPLGDAACERELIDG